MIKFWKRRDLQAQDQVTIDVKENEQNVEKTQSWSQRLTSGLSRSAQKLGGDIDTLFNKRKPDAETLEALEELLVTADLGPVTAAKLVETLREKKFAKDGGAEVKEALIDAITEILTPCAKPLTLGTETPQVVVMVGVNGTGKTTTIGKLARRFQAEGKKVLLAAGDTFRAAAVEQLTVWGERNGCTVVSGVENGDAAAVAYQALEKARAEAADVVFIDTAGRLHNKKNLMQELEKILRVIQKAQDGAPHHVILTLDATTGQNAFHQVETFKEMVNVTGLIVTKLDGSAKGGVVVGLADRFGLPIHAVGVGEGLDDLKPFDAQDFAQNLIGHTEL